jgi:hypothetical protein
MPYKGIHHFFRIVTYDGVLDSGQITVLGIWLGFVAGFKGKYQFPVTGISKFFLTGSPERQGIYSVFLQNP